jgi:hypothetical protein
MTQKTLQEMVLQKPFPEFADWWPVGEHFLTFMSNAIYEQWSALANSPQLEEVITAVSHYIHTVYGRSTQPHLVTNFIQKNFTTPIHSGEFDALSYAFFRSAFEHIEGVYDVNTAVMTQLRRAFTQRVGASFFQQLQAHLNLDIPTRLTTPSDFLQLKQCITQIGRFLTDEGYLLNHFDFRFDVQVQHSQQDVAQKETEVLMRLAQGNTAYALYEMRYPIILPSAVYLYHLIGEAQHHSSRTIEELFARIGYQARETDDFDPTGFPSDKVVELWEIRPAT